MVVTVSSGCDNHVAGTKLTNCDDRHSHQITISNSHQPSHHLHIPNPHAHTRPNHHNRHNTDAPATTASTTPAIITDGPPFTGTDGRLYRRLSYLQCFPCYKYRGKCNHHRPCRRCTDRHIQSHCIDVGPPCLPCQDSGAYCDRNRPCRKCKESGGEVGCVDGVEVGRKEEDVEVDERGEPLPLVVEEVVGGEVEEKKREATGRFKRMTEAEKLQVEMMDGHSNKRRRADDDEMEDDGKEEQQDSAAAMNGVPPAPTPPPPPPPVVDIVTMLKNEHWLPDDDDDDVDRLEQIKQHTRRTAAKEDAQPSPHHFDGHHTHFIDLPPTQQSDGEMLPPADFITDFNHLFPRPPLSSLSVLPTAFLNLWAHFMHKRKHNIVGHSVLLPATSASPQRHITAWDVYRCVVEHGGYYHVAQHSLWQRVMRQIVLSAAEWDGQGVRFTAAGTAPAGGSGGGGGEGDLVLTGGPPVPLPALKPRAFLTEYYERFLLLFEWTYQWRKGSTRPTMDESEKRRRVKRPKTALAYRNLMLHRLWPPEVTKAITDSGQLTKPQPPLPHSQPDDSPPPVHSAEPEEVLGYVGMQRLKRSLQSGVVEEVVWAVNRLLVLSERVARRRGGGVWEERELDDDEDSSDCNLVFVYELVDDLLRLLLYTPLVQDAVSATHPALAPLLLTAHINTLVSSTPALSLSSAAVTILHNLSLFFGNLRRLAANTTLVNLLVDVSSTAEVWRGEDDERTVLWCLLMRLTSAIDLRVVVRRQQLLGSIIERLRHYLDTALFPLVDVGENGVVVADDLSAGVSSVKAEEAVRGLVSLISNAHFSVNVPYLEAALPPSVFALLVLLTSPLTPSASLRLATAQSLAFFSLTAGTFVHHIVDAHGLHTLVNCLEATTDDSDSGRELRRTCAAAVQAIVSCCVRSAAAAAKGGGAAAGSDGGVRDAMLWEEVKALEEQLALACFKDADVNALLRHVLSTIEKERQEGKRKQAAHASH